MYVNDISRQRFSKIASRRFHGRMALTRQGLVLGAGTLLAKLDGKALPIEANQERIWTLLAVAYGHGTPLAVLGSLRRVAKHWQGGDKSLAAIHLAQMGLPAIGEDASYRLSLAAELIDAGLAPRELTQELGFDLPADLIKYDSDQPRVPAGSGRESGQWTSNGAGTGTQTQHRLTPAAPTPVQVAQDDVKCSAFISENCKGSILREFPSEYLDLSIDQLLKDAQAGVPAAKKGKKLLFDNRFRK